MFQKLLQLKRTGDQLICLYLAVKVIVKSCSFAHSGLELWLMYNVFNILWFCFNVSYSILNIHSLKKNIVSEPEGLLSTWILIGNVSFDTPEC